LQDEEISQGCGKPLPVVYQKDSDEKQIPEGGGESRSIDAEIREKEVERRHRKEQYRELRVHYLTDAVP
jgi:hypothetical protein